MFKNILRYSLLLLFFLLNLATVSAGQPTENVPEKITIQLKWRHSFQFAGYYAAKEKGFYAEEGLDVDLKEREISKPYIEEVVKGNAEYGTADAGLLLHRAKGEPIVLLKQIFQHSPLIFIAKKENGIVSPYEMIGKKVRFDPGSGNFAPLTAMLTETIGNLSQIIPVPQSYDLREFVEGDVDVISAYLSSQPFELEKMGVEFTIINPQNYGVDFYGDNLFTTEQELSTHPQRVAKVIRATLKGWKYALEHQKELIDIIIKKYNKNAGPEQLAYEAKMTERMIIPDLIRLGSVNHRRYSRIAEIYAELGLLSGAIVPNDFIFDDKMEQQVTLSSKEKSWLSEHPVLRVGVVHMGEPLEFLNKDGSLHGISIEYLEKIAGKIGVRLEFIHDSLEKLVIQLRNKELDVLTNVGITPERRGVLLFTEPYLEIPIGVFATEKFNFIWSLEVLADKPVAVLENSVIREFLNVNHSEIETVPVTAIEEALRLLEEEKVFAFMGNMLTTNYVINKEGHFSIHMVGDTPYASYQAFAVENASTVLHGILQKALDAIPPSERNTISNKWIMKSYEKKTDYSLLWKVGLVALFFSFCIFLWNRRLATEVARRTSALQDSEARFRAFMDNAPAYSAIKDEDLSLIYANKLYQQLLERAEKEGTPALAYDQKTADTIAHSEREILSGKSDLEKLEFKTDITGIGERYILDFKFPIILSGGMRLLGSLSYDVTEQNTARHERERLETQLRQAQKMEAVGRLAGGVAHDYNNMLNVILGYTELALERIKPTDPLYGDLKEVWNAADRSAEITRQLLAFARKQTVNPRVLSLNDTVDNMLKMLRRLIGEDIDLVWLPGSGLWPVNMDRSQLDQILANLCVNARDAINNVGKVTIETGNISFDETYCAIHHGFYPGDFVMLAVSDDGRGMEKETLERIFEPFFTTKGVSRGTGLGLSTVYGIVKQNGGFINVYSEPDKGTTFKVYLKRHTGEVEEPADEKVLENPEGRGETLLLVEDEKSILELGKKMLIGLGYNVITTTSPRKAIRLAREHVGEIHLLLTDVIMPEMNGRELAEHLRPMHPEIKVLFMSGYTSNVIAHHGVLEKGVHFVPKPFSLQELAVKVRETLES